MRHILNIRRGLGFTLIELLVVISVIGLLSSIVLTTANSARMKSRNARRKSDMNQL
ncbi:MAG: prepilin-type N-terminal cleavage/methylation domain-containing protein, partial [Patescibacteria group bacterium]